MWQPPGIKGGTAWVGTACQIRTRLEVHHVIKRTQGGSDFDLDRLVALCPPCHAQTDAPYARGRLVITPLGQGGFTFTVVGDPRLDEPRRWGVVVWIQHEAEELRVHHRATIPADEARALVVTLLASDRVPPLQNALIDDAFGAARPGLQRFWGTAYPRDDAVYLILFINERCLVLVVSG